MRANTSRELRFAFDAAAQAYDAGRPAFDARIVADLMREARLTPGSEVLEIGAGTGQLTGALLGAGLSVTALEPGGNLAAKLRENFGVGGRLEVIQATFEDFAPDTDYVAIAAANAFHWLDPAVSYRKAAELMRPGGALCLLWNFPILADANLQRRLNAEAFADGLEDLQRDPVTHDAFIKGRLAEGREELVASGVFAAPWWELVPRPLRLSPAAYVDLQNSYANAANARQRLKPAIARLVGDGPIELLNLVYLCVARKA